MASVNKVIIVGNLGRDPEMRYTSDGIGICTLSVATTYSWKDQSTGQSKEDTEWHRIVLFRKLAEIAQKYLQKGRPVYIEGRLKTRKWQDQNGIERYTTEIIADQMQMLGRVDSEQSAQAKEPVANTQYRAAPERANQPKPKSQDNYDIPF